VLIYPFFKIFVNVDASFKKSSTFKWFNIYIYAYKGIELSYPIPFKGYLSALYNPYSFIYTYTFYFGCILIKTRLKVIGSSSESQDVNQFFF